MSFACLHFLILEELNSSYYDNSECDELHKDNKALIDGLVSLAACIWDFCDGSVYRDMTMRSWVKIEHGRKAGNIGTIAGSWETRGELVRHGLTKAIVKIGNEYEVLQVENLRELSVQEQILLGVK